MAIITLTRINYAPTYTLGYIKHGEFFCFTLEPCKKEVHGCIPCGVYPIVWEYSLKFNTNLWELKNVPERSEIKIHAGNYEGQTIGCILPGYRFDIDILRLGLSSAALYDFNRLCQDQKITEIEVREV